MSIVAFFYYRYKKQIRIKIINKIDDLHYGFVPANNLHSTLLTIPSKNIFQEKSNDYFKCLIKKQLINFFHDRKKISRLIVKFNEFRPVTFFSYMFKNV